MAAFFVLVGVFAMEFSRVVHRFAVGVAGFDVGGVVDTRGMRSCVTSAYFSNCCIILIIRHCVVWSFCFMSSVIVHVPDA